MRAEKDIRLRIDLLEGQSSSIAKMLAKAISDRNEAAFRVRRTPCRQPGQG